MVELLSTKFFVPRPRSNLVARPRLVERLNGGLECKLTLIAAPAGFGKTTLLSEWSQHSPRHVSWLSLDEGDQDPTYFWAYFITALQGLHPGLGEIALSLLQSPEAPPIPAILTALINDISAFPETFAIVLEDYHFIDFQPIHEGLIFLIAHQPANMHLIITTRADPPLPLARLRARDKLTELRANDLRFTAEEAAEFLNQVMGLNLSTEDIAALEQRTEGWIAGLQIAALSMQGHDDISGFIRAFSGSHRHILGYLADEVLNQRPKGTLNFLLQTAILDRLCGSLCDAVTEASGGQELLENLARANLFITPLDDEGVWYRYHPLFADVLQARLQRTQHKRVAELHRRAVNWHEKQGMMDEAVHHALAGADFEEAAQLIEVLAGKMLLKGSSSSLIRWLDAMPDEMVRVRPRLCLARGWTYLWGPTPNLGSANEWMELASQSTLINESSDANIAGELAALQSWIAAIQWDTARSRLLSQQALDYLPIKSPWRSVMVFCLGTVHYYTGEMIAATNILNEALSLSQTDGTQYIQLMAASFLADIKRQQGHLGQAIGMYQQILRDSHDIPQRGVVLAHSGMANILYEHNRLDEALDHLQLGAEQLDQVGGAWAALILYLSLARVQYAKGDMASALVTLDQAWQIGQNAQVDFVMKQVASMRARLQIAQDDLKSAKDWVEETGIEADDPEVNYLGLQEDDYLVLARMLDARGRHSEALSLLSGLLNVAEAKKRYGSVIAILAYQSVVLKNHSKTTIAFQSLERALTLAEPEGYIRTFVDEGETMHQLLHDFQMVIKKRISNSVDSETLRLLTYIDMLLAAFSLTRSTRIAKDALLLEPLSERELDILRLIATGRSNQEIADILVIALSTVKSHINRLYAKLGVNRRTRAIAMARDLGLLAE